MLTAILGWLSRTVPHLKRPFWGRLYERLARDRDALWRFMNYGFEDPDAPRPALDPADEPDRYGIQLYHHVVSAVDLRGRTVLEVGCGRGGGASYITRYLRPRLLVGMDLSPGAAALCRRHAAGGAFVSGDAQALPFPAERFDAVVNVESSHCYPRMEAFSAEAFRVLRPGGVLLFADLRLRGAHHRLREQLLRPGFRVLRELDITAHVVRALHLDSPRRKMWIRDKVPGIVRAPFEAFAGVAGTTFYRMLRDGKGAYLSFVLQKP